MLRLLLLFAFLVVSCSPRPPAAIQPTATLPLSLGAQAVANQQTATAAVASGRMTELEIISATEAAAIQLAALDLSARQADIERQNVINEHLIPVFAEQTLVAVRGEGVIITYAQATAAIEDAYAQATAAIVEANTRREIEAADHQFDFLTWLQCAGVLIAFTIVAGAVLHVVRNVQIGLQEDRGRALTEREHMAITRTAEYTALIAQENAYRAQVDRWRAGMERFSDGRAYVLIYDKLTGEPKAHWVVKEPLALLGANADNASEAVINHPQDKKTNDIIIKQEDINLNDPIALQQALLDFIDATIALSSDGVNSRKLLHYSNMPKYHSGAWTKLSDILAASKLIIKIPRKWSIVNPDSNMHNLGDLRRHVTNGLVRMPTSPPNGTPLKSSQQAINTGKTAKTDRNRGDGAGGQFHTPLIIEPQS